ncbi:hypothetical protein [Micrococcus lylae]|uniref:hypothetical protein n=1 Tax=Micrococcus lylae TaxID=1273 RepID=UPI000C7FA5FD|nr:hypothetical protein [Micrococcus lylae]WIK82389.1 hypothetical protein CJ228_000725 [Micrococcus lylae]
MTGNQHRPLTPDTCIRAVRRPWTQDPATREVYALPPGHSQAVRLSAAASALWQAAVEPTTVRLLVSRFALEAPAEDTAEDMEPLVLACAGTLLQCGLIVTVPPRTDHDLHPDG